MTHPYVLGLKKFSFLWVSVFKKVADGLILPYLVEKIRIKN